MGRQRRRYDDARIESHQFAGQLVESVEVAVREAILKKNVAPLDIAELLYGSAEGPKILRRRGSGAAVQDTDESRGSLPCARRKRPCRHAAEERNELPPPHSITSSARARKLGGISRPSALAVKDELEQRWLHVRHFCGAGTFEDLAYIDAGLAVHPGDARPVAQKPARCRELPHEIHRRQHVLLSEGYDLVAAIQHDRVGRGDEGVCLCLEKLLKGTVDLARVAGIEHKGLEAERPCAGLGVRLLGGGSGVAWMKQ